MFLVQKMKIIMTKKRWCHHIRVEQGKIILLSEENIKEETKPSIYLIEDITSNDIREKKKLQYI
jgi:hypothetical protein